MRAGAGPSPSGPYPERGPGFGRSLRRGALPTSFLDEATLREVGDLVGTVKGGVSTNFYTVLSLPTAQLVL